MIVHLSLKNPTCDPLLLIMIKYGFVFSLVGDTLLMFSSLLLFMVGTSFFLIAHILYCVAETIGNKSTRTITSENRKKQIGGCIFLFLMFIGNVNTLWNVMPNQFLFTLYGGILCLMNILSLLRYSKTTADSFLQMALGAFLFGISDNLLALLKFNGISTNVGRMMIMLTYYMGQYFIMHGCISHVMKKNELR